MFFGARSDPELKAAQAQKSELSRDELREFFTEVILTPAGIRSANSCLSLLSEWVVQFF